MRSHFTSGRPTSDAPASSTATSTGLLQRQRACCQHVSACGECSGCGKEREGLMQRSAVSASSITGVPPIVHDVLRSPGQPLDAQIRAFIEPRFGHDFSRIHVHGPRASGLQAPVALGSPGDIYEHEADMMAERVIGMPSLNPKEGASPLAPTADFSDVRIHTDSQAAESARAVNARAYTMGQDIVFGAGRYAPETAEGQRLLAHELAHVVQGNPARASDPSHAVVRRSVEADAARIESLLSYGVLDWAITDEDAIEALEILSNLPVSMQQAVLRRINVGRLRENLPVAHVSILERILTAAGGEVAANVRTKVERIQDLLSYNVIDWAITDADATEALNTLLSLSLDEQQRVVLVINYQRLYDNLPTETQKTQLAAIRGPAAAAEVATLGTMEGYRARALVIVNRIKANASALSIPSPPASGAFENWLSNEYLANYCTAPNSRTADAAIEQITEVGSGGFSHYGFGLLRGMADRANAAGISYIDSPYLLGTPAPIVTGPGGELWDPWSQGPNLTQLMHFAAGMKWSWAPAFIIQWYFVHYEQTSREGWQLFGLDSLNDVIAEEGSRLFAEDLKGASATCSGGMIDLDSYFARGRSFLRSQLSEAELDRLALRAYQPIMVIAVNPAGTVTESRALWNATIMEQIMAGASDADILATPDARILTLLYHLIRTL